MPSVAVLGAQWGDEGKGKIVDLLTPKADVVARFQGGPNAGHTVVVQGQQYILHALPTGVLHPGKKAVIGNGAVIDPVALCEEIDRLRDRGIDVKDTLLISRKAHLILPYHRAMDVAREAFRGERRIGTTGRGIGPAYTDKTARMGIRFADLFDEALLHDRLQANLAEKNPLIQTVYGHAGFELEALVAWCLEWRDKLASYLVDAEQVLREAILRGENVLFEGAQGAMLDIDHGTYPFVTSSNTTIGAVCTGLGVPPSRIDHVVGVAKAYTTRVGMGPFPTELLDHMGERMRTVGAEYGATTGRARRCGWFDVVMVRQAAWLNGFTSLSLTKLDVLDRYDRVKLCVAYEYKGKCFEQMPDELEVLTHCRPQYIELPGWQESTQGLTAYDQLPPGARAYIEELSQRLALPVSMISTGSGREQTVLLRDPFESRA
jgi:adenylosuccinate synthase